VREHAEALLSNGVAVIVLSGGALATTSCARASSAPRETPALL